MAQYALIDHNNVLQNIVEWDGVAPYSPPGVTLELASLLPPGGSIGATLTNGAWIAAPTPAPAVPASVALWQAKAALEAAGLATQAEAVVAAAKSPALTAFWATAPTIDRNSPTLAKIAAALSLTDAQVDALFIAAATILL